MRGKLIVIEGTDSSGKETQAKILVERLQKENAKIVYKTFPNYNSPTGKIVGGPYLGKPNICEGWFKENAVNVDPKVASLYFAADRKYNISELETLLNNGYNIILDRYTDSNMAHQAGKIFDKKKRLELYKWIEDLEFGLLELPKPDYTVFLHLPYQYSVKALQLREEKADQHESSEEHLKNAEQAYLEIAKMHNYITIECIENNRRRHIDELGNEIYEIVNRIIK